MNLVAGLILLVLLISGCANLPIKDGELSVSEHTKISVDDGAVAKIKNKF